MIVFKYNSVFKDFFFLRSWEMNLGKARDKSREPGSGSRKICHCLTQVHFPRMQENKTLIPY